jgi:hypothetical protein
LALHQNPENFGKKQQGYFNYLHGIMLSQTNINQRNISKAIELGLSMDAYKLNLAGVAT